MQRKGFTLIELLVVIAIIAILAAILFPVFAKPERKQDRRLAHRTQNKLVWRTACTFRTTTRCWEDPISNNA